MIIISEVWFGVKNEIIMRLDKKNIKKRDIEYLRRKVGKVNINKFYCKLEYDDECHIKYFSYKLPRNIAIVPMYFKKFGLVTGKLYFSLVPFITFQENCIKELYRKIMKDECTVKFTEVDDNFELYFKF